MDIYYICIYIYIHIYNIIHIYIYIYIIYTYIYIICNLTIVKNIGLFFHKGPHPLKARVKMTDPLARYIQI